MRLVFFDLDGTITRRDTLLPYVARFVVAHPARWWRLPLLLPPILEYVLAGRDRGALKGSVLRVLLGGLSRTELESWTRAFVPRLLRHGVYGDAIDRIRAHRAAGDRLVLMSASVDLYVPAIGEALGFDEVLCSRVGWDGDRLVGDLVTANCRDAEKVRLLEAERARHPGRVVIAYGNSRPDLPHLERVDEGYLVNAPESLIAPAFRDRIRVLRWS